MLKWINKVAIVTGASSGIGKDIAIRLVDHGLKVVGCSRDFNYLANVKNEISIDSKGEFVPFKCDISKEEDVLKMFEFVKENFKELSILINNAGLGFYAPIIKCRTESLKIMFGTNVLGLCMCTREAYKMMRENENLNQDPHEKPGHIININSISGNAVSNYTGTHFYSVTKFAAKAITEATRQELREEKSKIRITQITPGVVDTEIFLRAGKGSNLDYMKNAIGEILRPSDISDAVIYALSAEPRTCVNDIIMRPTNQKE